MILLVFKKYKKKSKFTKKKKSRDKVWGPNNILPTNSSFQHTQKKWGVILTPPHHPEAFFSFPQFQPQLTIFGSTPSPLHSPLLLSQKPRPTPHVLWFSLEPTEKKTSPHFPSFSHIPYFQLLLPNQSSLLCTPPSPLHSPLLPSADLENPTKIKEKPPLLFDRTESLHSLISIARSLLHSAPSGGRTAAAPSLSSLSRPVGLPHLADTTDLPVFCLPKQSRPRSSSSLCTTAPAAPASSTPSSVARSAA